MSTRTPLLVPMFSSPLAEALSRFLACKRAAGCRYDDEARALGLLDQFLTTTLELPGYRITRNLGVVRGIVVRSRSIVGTIGAGIQSLFGGNITLWTEMCERARQEAFDLMARHAEEMGANAVIGIRYDANEVSAGVTEVLAYGSAAVVEPDRR